MTQPLDFIDKYGLLVATLLLLLTTVCYSVATFLMWRVMFKEYVLKTTSRLVFKPSVVQANGWNSLILSQEVINIGVSYLSIEEAFFEWNLVIDKESKHQTWTSDQLPCYLAPKQSTVLTFKVTEDQIPDVNRTQFNSVSEVIEGVIRYNTKGLTDKIEPYVHTPNLISQDHEKLGNGI